MSKPPLEKNIVKKILQWLNDMDNCRARHHTATGPYNQSGEPDIDGVLAGRALKVEVKRTMRRAAPPLHEHSKAAYEARGATPLQAKTLMEWHQAGALTGVVSSLDEMKAALAPLLES